LQRLLTTAILVGLLVATAAAFAVTERLKLTKSAIYGTHVSKVFSPTCGCARGRANVHVRLRRADTVTVTILDARKQPVSVIAAEPLPRGPITFPWTGLTDAGTRARDGTYYAELHLAGQHQTIVLPNRIQLDTSPPRIVDASQNRDVFSPDGDRQADFVQLRYKLSKEAHVVLYLDGQKILGPTYHHPVSGEVAWRGIAAGQTLPAGSYTLELGAVDLAGNSTPLAERWRVHVRIRYIELASHRIVARAGRRFEIGVSTDAVGYGWKLGKRHSFTSGSVLRLRAPQRRGRYTLTVTEHGHSSRAAVIVR
jgi:hypothetical protein